MIVPTEDNDILKSGVDFLYHHGIKGMHWGIRNDRTPGVSFRTDRQAKKHAQEFARAKMFFGEGAGTRRKLIKNRVEAKSKKDPAFKKAFDHHLAREDLGKHASAARSERHRKDISKNTKQTAGALARRFTGEQGTKAAFIAAAIGGFAYLNSPSGKKHLHKGINALNSAQGALIRKQGARKLKTLFDVANTSFG